MATLAAIMKSSIRSRARFFRVDARATRSCRPSPRRVASIVSNSSAPRCVAHALEQARPRGPAARAAPRAPSSAATSAGSGPRPRATRRPPRTRACAWLSRPRAIDVVRARTAPSARELDLDDDARAGPRPRCSEVRSVDSFSGSIGNTVHAGVDRGRVRARVRVDRRALRHQRVDVGDADAHAGSPPSGSARPPRSGRDRASRRCRSSDQRRRAEIAHAVASGVSVRRGQLARDRVARLGLEAVGEAGRRRATRSQWRAHAAPRESAAPCWRACSSTTQALAAPRASPHPISSIIATPCSVVTGGGGARRGSRAARRRRTEVVARLAAQGADVVAGADLAPARLGLLVPSRRSRRPAGEQRFLLRVDAVLHVRALAAEHREARAEDADVRAREEMRDDAALVGDGDEHVVHHVRPAGWRRSNSA